MWRPAAGRQVHRQQQKAEATVASCSRHVLLKGDRSSKQLWSIQQSRQSTPQRSAQQAGRWACAALTCPFASSTASRAMLAPGLHVCNEDTTNLWACKETDFNADKPAPPVHSHERQPSWPTHPPDGRHQAGTSPVQAKVVMHTQHLHFCLGLKVHQASRLHRRRRRIAVAGT